MGQILSHTYTYYSGLFHYLWGDGRYKPYQKLLLECGGSTTSTSSTFRRLEPEPTDTPDKRLFKRYARIHLYTLASNFYLYDKPHYRKGTYREDLVDVSLLWIMDLRAVSFVWSSTYGTTNLLCFFFPFSAEFEECSHTWYRDPVITGRCQSVGRAWVFINCLSCREFGSFNSRVLD